MAIADIETTHSGNQPYILLENETSSTNTSMTYIWELWYYSAYPMNTSKDRYISAFIKASGSGKGWEYLWYGDYDIDGLSGWHKIANGKKTINRTHSQQTVSFEINIYFDGLNVSGTSMGQRQGTHSVTISAKPSYTIKYNSNGAGTTISNQTKWYGEALTLRGTQTRTGYTFQGWNTKADGTGTTYKAGASYTGNAALTLYAIWKENTYTVTLNYNYSSKTATKTKYYTKTLSLGTLTRTNYYFKGWSKSNTTPTIITTWTENKAGTVYAQWIPNVIYQNSSQVNSNEKSDPVIVKTNSYTLLTSLPSTFTKKANTKLKQWKGSDGKTYNPGQAITLAYNSAVLTLTAVLEEAEPGPEPEPEPVDVYVPANETEEDLWNNRILEYSLSRGVVTRQDEQLNIQLSDSGNDIIFNCSFLPFSHNDVYQYYNDEVDYMLHCEIYQDVEDIQPISTKEISLNNSDYQIINNSVTQDGFNFCKPFFVHICKYKELEKPIQSDLYFKFYIYDNNSSVNHLYGRSFTTPLLLLQGYSIGAPVIDIKHFIDGETNRDIHCLGINRNASSTHSRITGNNQGDDIESLDHNGNLTIAGDLITKGKVVVGGVDGIQLARIKEDQQITISKSAGSPAPLFVSERSDLGLKAGFGINSTDSLTPNIGIYENDNGTGKWLLSWSNNAINNFAGFDDFFLKRHPIAVAYLSSNQTLSATAGTITKINLASWNYRSDTSLFSFSNNGIVMPYTGRILILGSIRYSNYANTNGCYLQHGTTYASSAEQAGIYATGNNPIVWKILNVEADDIIWMAGRSSAASGVVNGLTGDGKYATSLAVIYLTRS